MERTLIDSIKDRIGQEITIKGWVQAIRTQGGINFLIIRDITGLVQAVVTKEAPGAFAALDRLTLESVVEISGLASEEQQAPGGYEVKAMTMEILSRADPELPIPVVEKAAYETDQQIRLDWRWLDLRKPEKALIFKVWTTMKQNLREK